MYTGAETEWDGDPSFIVYETIHYGNFYWRFISRLVERLEFPHFVTFPPSSFRTILLIVIDLPKFNYELTFKFKIGAADHLEALGDISLYMSVYEVCVFVKSNVCCIYCLLSGRHVNILVNLGMDQEPWVYAPDIDPPKIPQTCSLRSRTNSSFAKI